MLKGRSVAELERAICLAVFPCDYQILNVLVSPRPPWIVVAGDTEGTVLFFRIENLDRA